MDSTEDSVKKPIDAIEFYDFTSNERGKKSLTLSIVKTRLTESAKMRLNTTYDSNSLLIADLKEYFIKKIPSSTAD